MRRPRSRRILAGTGLAVAAATGTAAAHGGTGGSGVPIPAVIGASALVGVATGLGTVRWGAGRAATLLTRRRFVAALAVGLVVLGVAFLVPAAADRPVLAAGAAAVGIAVARVVPHRHAGTLDDPGNGLPAVVLAAVLLHRAFEGVVLAAGFLAGSTVGTATAALVTLHGSGETAAVAGLYAVAGRPRTATAAVLAVQGGFVVAAAVAVAAAVSVSMPLAAEAVVVAGVAGVLVSFGLHECRQCYLDWTAA
jgi:zinc transporter ZupT